MQKAVLHLVAADPVMASIIERVGPFRAAYRPPEFETLVRSVTFQQLSGKAAATIYGRLEAAVGAVTPENLSALGPEQLRAQGLSRQKTATILDLAEKTRAGEVRFQDLPGLSDADVIERLTRVKGIGVWTAQMFLMFALRRPDVLPVGDLGIRAAMKRHYRMRELPKPERMMKVARPWRPHASVACWYLWRSLDGEAAI
jgi:DNA-3-methyladenine glycosylase II